MSGIDTDGDNDSVGMAASAHTANTRHIIYDTGALHHFVRCESMFRNMYIRQKPLRFDHAVGITHLTKQGVAEISIGDLHFDLSDLLYSPKSSCIIISAGRLQRLGKITSNSDMTRLIISNADHEEVPIAKLI